LGAGRGLCTCHPFPGSVAVSVAEKSSRRKTHTNKREKIKNNDDKQQREQASNKQEGHLSDLIGWLGGRAFARDG